MYLQSYKEAGIPFNKERQESRNSGLESFFEKYSTEEIKDVIELFFLGKGTKDFISGFAEYFQEHDPSFDEDNMDEMRLLAGNVLYDVVLEQEEDEDFAIRLWSIMYRFLGNDGFSAVITNEIIKSFYNDSAVIREKINLSAGSSVEHFEGGFFDIENGSFIGDGSFSADTATSLQNMADKLNELIDSHNRSLASTTEICELLHEDTQIIWWIIGGHSDLREKRYQDLEEKEAAYLIGRDLADLISVYPGPVSARQMIGHMVGEKNRYSKVSIAEFVDSIDDDLVSDGYDSTPLLFALSKKKESGAGHWNKQVKDRFGMDVEQEVEIEKLAYEIYIEWIFAKCCSED